MHERMSSKQTPSPFVAKRSYGLFSAASKSFLRSAVGFEDSPCPVLDPVNDGVTEIGDSERDDEKRKAISTTRAIALVTAMRMQSPGCCVSRQHASHESENA